jgi:hypothetical protein
MFVTSSSCKAKYCLSASDTAIGVISGVLVLSSENVKINLPAVLELPANFSVRLCSI